MTNPYSTPDPKAQPPVRPNPQKSEPQPASSRRPDPKPAGPRRPGKQKPLDPTHPDQVAGRKALWRFLLTVLGAAIVMMLPNPVPLLGVVLVPAAVVVGLWALPKVLKLRPRGLNVFSWVLSMLFALYLSLSVIGVVMLYPQVSAHQECMDSALTKQAQRTCQVEYERSVSNFLDGLVPGGLPGSGTGG